MNSPNVVCTTFLLATALSAAARLAVITLPIITRQPASLTVALGETITLRVEAQSARGC